MPFFFLLGLFHFRHISTLSEVKFFLPTLIFKLLPRVPGASIIFKLNYYFNPQTEKKKRKKKLHTSKHMPFVQPLERKVVDVW
jgi:hypothetical protein